MKLSRVILVPASRLSLSILADGSTLRGRPILNLIVREFDLDNALGGMISAVELFQIHLLEGDHASLVSYG